MRIPENLPMDATAPLLCAGITVFSPFKDSNLVDTPGKRVGVVGLGGLGHVAVKFGKAFGHHVTVISTSPSKEKEARERLGADDFIVSTNAQELQVCYPLLPGSHQPNYCPYIIACPLVARIAVDLIGHWPTKSQVAGMGPRISILYGHKLTSNLNSFPN